MRQTPATIAGLAGLPVAAVALIALLPLASGRRTESGSAAGPDASRQRSSVNYPRMVDSTDIFRVGRILVHELLGRDPAEEDTVRALVALLPDPAESSLDWTYDADLAALRQSLESSGYLGDRMWFPNPRDSASDLDIQGHRDTTALKRAAPEIFPGVMLFRGTDATRGVDALVVYVVGELPTSGAHTIALRNALDEAADLDDSDTLRILGPTFSGSFFSLRSTIESWSGHNGCRVFRVVTGSATSAKGREYMATPGTLDCGVSGDDSDSTTTLRFAATVHNDDEYLRVVDGLLRDLDLRSSDVALLAEGGTAYGQQRIQGPDSSSAADSSTAPDSSSAADNSNAADGSIVAGALRIPFPLNAGVVRTAYERNPEPVPQDAISFTPTARLPLTLNLEPRPLQAPVPSSRLTAPTVDLVLGDAMETLRAHHVRAVGIMASDVRDKLFLAELIRHELPDVLLFTLEGNVLFARKDLSHVMRGTVVASTYPLIGQNGAWLRSHDFTGFPLEGAAGVFNAAALLLDQPDRVQQYRAPLPTPIQACLGGISRWILERFGQPADTSHQVCDRKGDSVVIEDGRPPVWLTVVGGGMLLPLAVAPDAALRESMRSDTTDLAAVPSTGTGDPGFPDPSSARVQPYGLPGSAFRPGVLGYAGIILGCALLVLPLAIVAQTLWMWLRALVLSLLVVARKWWPRLRSPGGSTDRKSRPRTLLDFIREKWTSNDEPSTGWSVDVIQPKVWSFADAIAVIVALLASLAPLAVMNGIAPPWRMTNPLLLWAGFALMAELLALCLVLAVHLSRLIWSADWKSTEWSSMGAALISHVLSLVLGVLGLWYGGRLLRLAATDSVRYGLYRVHTLDLDSGVSGLLPFLLASVGAVLLVLWHRNRRQILHENPGRSGADRSPSSAETERCSDFNTATLDECAFTGDPKAPGDRDSWGRALHSVGTNIGQIRQCLDLRVDVDRDVPRVNVVRALVVVLPVLLAVIAAWTALWLVNMGYRTLENVALGPWAMPTVVLWTGLACGFFGVMATMVHLFALWRCLRRFLVSVSETPIGTAFSRIPDRLRSMGRLHLFDPPAGRLGHVLAEAGHEAVWKDASWMKTTELEGLRLTRTDAKNMADELSRGTSRHESQEKLLESLRHAWTLRPWLVWTAGSEGGEQKPDTDDHIGQWLRHVEDLFAVEGTVYVGWVLRNLRRITILMLVMIVFTTAMLESIPFPHHTVLTGLFIVVVIFALALVVTVMLQLAQDDVLSRINGTEPGKINFRGASLLTALVFVAVPVFGLLGSEVTPVGKTFFGWLTNLLRVLSGG